jgi:hypothetical protein
VKIRQQLLNSERSLQKVSSVRENVIFKPNDIYGVTDMDFTFKYLMSMRLKVPARCEITYRTNHRNNRHMIQEYRSPS